jgi:hypothetical protein
LCRVGKLSRLRETLRLFHLHRQMVKKFFDRPDRSIH